MKSLMLIPVAAAVLLAGCGQNAGSTNTSAATNAATNTNINYASGNPLTAVPDYVGVVGQAQKYSEKQIDLAYLHEAIEQYNVVEGHYPKNLQELVPNYIGKMPEAPYGSKIVYDPNSGSVTVVKQ